VHWGIVRVRGRERGWFGEGGLLGAGGWDGRGDRWASSEAWDLWCRSRSAGDRVSLSGAGVGWWYWVEGRERRRRYNITILKRAERKEKGELR